MPDNEFTLDPDKIQWLISEAQLVVSRLQRSSTSGSFIHAASQHISVLNNYIWFFEDTERLNDLPLEQVESLLTSFETSINVAKEWLCRITTRKLPVSWF